MRLLHLAFLDGTVGSFRKFKEINSQFWAIQRQNRDSGCIIIGENHANLDFSGMAFEYIDINNFVFTTAAHSRQVRYRLAAAMIRQYEPDIVFCLYPWADEYLYELVCEFPQFVFEHQTKEVPELHFNNQSSTLRLELIYGEKVLSKVMGIVAVSEDYLAYELERSGFSAHGCTMPNGVDVAQIPVRMNRVNDQCIEILCLASFCKWHGYDRLIEGVRNYRGKDKILVHMVGTGPELSHYKKMVKEYTLDNYFKFWGRLESEAFGHIVETCHLAVGALGLHRKDLHITASLKNREYCAMGVPFIYSGKDTDFNKDEKFLLSVLPSDDPLDMVAVIGFARQVYQDGDPGPAMRRFAEKYLSWDVKVGILLSFLETLPYTDRKGRDPNAVIHTRDLFAALLEDESLSRSSILDQQLVEAAVARELGDRITSAAIYGDTLGQSQKPGKYLFRLLVELEQLLPGEKDLLDRLSKHIVQLYCDVNHLDFTESYRLASLYKKNGQLKEAQELFEKALDLDQLGILKGGIYFHLGEINLEMGHRREAENMFRLCLENIPDHRKAMQYLGKKPR
jgi:glycosyltransferase involved in cell wall biosynthesis